MSKINVVVHGVNVTLLKTLGVIPASSTEVAMSTVKIFYRVCEIIAHEQPGGGYQVEIMPIGSHRPVLIGEIAPGRIDAFENGVTAN